MKKSYVLISLTMVSMILVSIVSAVSAATITTKEFSGKGAIAQWYIEGRTINAIVYMSNSEKDGQIYVSIKHATLGGAISEASGPVEFKWSMNHVTAKATLYFEGPPSRTGWHEVSITWQTSGPTSNNGLLEDTGHEMTAAINGAWKSASAVLTLYTPIGGHHGGTPDVYTSTWAVVVHGDAEISLATP